MIDDSGVAKVVRSRAFGHRDEVDGRRIVRAHACLTDARVPAGRSVVILTCRCGIWLSDSWCDLAERGVDL
jgi:hypothetical protein